ncbi:MAG TPA: TrkA family potassium uptake protein, partial [Pseudogracilibacillus sp.]|nr:TrkA family potassium uptake protein [Pseudogracilibacillus sp.]
ALKALGIQNMDHVIVAIGDNIQASILTTVILSELGTKRITVKAQNDYHEKILNKIGADVVVHPERDMGKRLAHSLMSNNIIDYLELSEEHSMVEVKSGRQMIGKNLIELDIRAVYGCNVVAIRRQNDMIISPEPTLTIKAEDILVILGADEDISRFEKDLIID